MMSLALYGISAVSKENKINKRNSVWEKQSEPPAQRHHKTAHMFIYMTYLTLSQSSLPSPNEFRYALPPEADDRLANALWKAD